jgi:hypothetical protein
MASELAAVPKSEIVARYQRMKNTLKNAKKETEQVATRAMHATAALGGGAVCGVMRGWEDEAMMVPGTEIPADVALAALAIGAGVTGMAGNASDSAVAFGSGLGSAALAFHVKEAVANRNK